MTPSFFGRATELAELAAAARDAAAPLRASLFGAEAEQRAAESFKSARPFPHIVLRDLIVDSESREEAARDETDVAAAAAAAAAGTRRTRRRALSLVAAPAQMAAPATY